MSDLLTNAQFCASGQSEVKEKYLETHEIISAPESQKHKSSIPEFERILNLVNRPDDSTECRTNEETNVGGSLLPLRYHDVIPSIIKSIESGCVCFLNPQSLELEEVPGKMLDNPEAFYISSGSSVGQKPFQHLRWNDCLMFNPIREEALQKLAEDFMPCLKGKPGYEKLVGQMKKRKPFAKLNALIKKLGHSDIWGRHKSQHLELIIEEKLTFMLNDDKEKQDEVSYGI